VLFFDCDKDGDQDLFVGSAGNNRDDGSVQLQDRLYKNDGKGNFTYDSLALPKTGTNNAIVAANDIDNDGDLDLFVGSRSISFNYGPDPASYIWLNNGAGQFTDATKQTAPQLETAGLITGAQWVDVLGDSKKELVVVGEWMAPRVFTFENGQLKEAKTNLGNLSGWWQSMASADLDGDGDMDLVLGNIGENFYLQPDSSQPVKMWMNDYDKNGSVEKIITRTIDGRDMPVFLKRELTDQLVVIKKQNLKYEEFGKKSIQELFTPEVIKECKVKLFNYNSSCIAYNDGNGHFTIQKLPMDWQFSSVNTILATDINGDGKQDLVAGGNRFDLLPQFCRLDASFGHVLINSGDKKWKELSSQQSGLLIRGQLRDIVEWKSKNNRFVLFLQNDDLPLLYKISPTKSEKSVGR
jgi:enediyne biosynthesis protein E4